MLKNTLAHTFDLILIPVALFCIVGITLGLCLFDSSPTRTARESIVVVRTPATPAPTVQLRGQGLAGGGTCAPWGIAARAAR